jgi:hypothetical protein
MSFQQLLWDHSPAATSPPNVITWSVPGSCTRSTLYPPLPACRIVLPTCTAPIVSSPLALGLRVLVLRWFLKPFPFPHLFVALLFCRSMLLVGIGTGCKCYLSLLCTSEVKLHTVIGKCVPCPMMYSYRVWLGKSPHLIFLWSVIGACLAYICVLVSCKG